MTASGLSLKHEMKMNYDPQPSTTHVTFSESSGAREAAKQVSLTGRIQIGFTPCAPWKVIG